MLRWVLQNKHSCKQACSESRRELAFHLSDIVHKGPNGIMRSGFAPEQYIAILSAIIDMDVGNIEFCLYIFAPVAAFAYFHKYENFEEKIEDYHRSQTSASAIKNEIMITEFQQKLREKRDQKFKDELEHIRATEAGELKEKLANLENIANK